MAFRIMATTDADRELLDAIRDLAWRQRQQLSEVVRDAFRRRLEEEEEQ